MYSFVVEASCSTSNTVVHVCSTLCNRKFPESRSEVLVRIWYLTVSVRGLCSSPHAQLPVLENAQELVYNTILAHHLRFQLTMLCVGKTISTSCAVHGPWPPGYPRWIKSRYSLSTTCRTVQVSSMAMHHTVFRVY